MSFLMPGRKKNPSYKFSCCLNKLSSEMGNRYLIAFFFCFMWRITAASATERCKVQDLCTLPDMVNSSGLYDLQLSSQEYSTTENGKTQISVQVKMTTCPTLQSAGPKYYKLEAYINSSMAPAGTFNKPLQSSEAELCADNEIVFSSYDPRVTDLPRTYGWNAPAMYIGDICFRLTIVMEEQETICEEVIKCISPDSPPSAYTTAAPSAMTEDQSDDKNEDKEVAVSDDEGVIDVALDSSDSGSQESSHAAACYKRRNNCTGAKMKLMCASDGNEYPSRCHVKLQACLTGRDIRVVQAGECPPPPTESVVGQCFDERETILNSPSALAYGWIPSCDSNGYHKPIQCTTVYNECWCSTKQGARIGNNRPFNCDRTDFSHCLLA